jgi:hypothetical protein
MNATLHLLPETTVNRDSPAHGKGSAATMNEEPFPDESNNRRDGGSEAAASLQPTHQHVRLPPELIDMIIAELRTDRAALASCALVCKSWLPASRNNLFFHITISPGSYYNASQIPSSAIALATKHLTIEGITHFGDLHQLFGRLSLISLVQNLEILELERVRIPTPGMLRLLLTHSRRLKSLVFREVSFIDPLGDHVLQPPVVGQDIPMPELKLLAVCESLQLLSWLASFLRNAAPQLTIFNLEVGTWASFHQKHLMESMLEVIGMRLRDFRFSVILEDKRECSSDKSHFHSYSFGAHNVYPIYLMQHLCCRVSLVSDVSDNWNRFPFNPMRFGGSTPTSLWSSHFMRCVT